MINLQAGLSELDTAIWNLSATIENNFYSDSQESNMSEIMAALVITLRRQTIMWERLTGVSGFEENTGDGDED